MSFPVNPGKVLQLFSPLWALLALSLWLHWDQWQSSPMLLAAIAFLPILAAIGAGFMRERWRLELTPEALVHHTLGRTERFEWARMGPLTLSTPRILGSVLVRTFWFAYPLDGARSMSERASKGIGRRILCVFGDLSARETMKQIGDWRAMVERPN